MGLAVAGDRLAIGTALEIWEYHNAPAVARRLSPAGVHDACFLPRSSVCTGDIQIHEMAWADGELWFVNTRFSCLCTRSNQHSFQPRWRPPFVTALAPEDRCHLNGLALASDEHGRLLPRFVTALGTTDTRGGWRANKRNGGRQKEEETVNALAPCQPATEPVEDPGPEPATEPAENPKPQPPPLRSIHRIRCRSPTRFVCRLYAPPDASRIEPLAE
jgi:hypothetical protein